MQDKDKDSISPLKHSGIIHFCGWWSTSCETGGIYSQARLGSAAGRHCTRPASDDIWCTIGTRGKLDYGTQNGIDSLPDRFTDPRWIEYRRKGCKTHHRWITHGLEQLVWFRKSTQRPLLIYLHPDTLPTHLLTPHTSSWKFRRAAVFCINLLSRCP